MSAAPEQGQTSQHIASDLAAGVVLAGRFTVVAKMADGAVASVYRAVDVQGGSTVALKVLDPLRGADPVGRQRFEREFHVLQGLQHSSISRCLGMVRDGELDILVLEFVEGETLAQRLSKGRFTVREAVQRTLELCGALEMVHGQGVLHRDLKPANIMVHPQRGAVILDFGVAWFSSAANLTRTGAVVGSPQYLAPEALSSSLWDARADVYALGVMLFEMLCGRTVYAATTVAELALLHTQGDVPLVSTIRPEVDAELAHVVARATAVRPEQRFASVGELARALQNNLPDVGKTLQARIPCKTCGTPLVIDLPFCPGCGVEASWELTSGPFAVQLDRVPDVKATAAWLQQRHASSLKVASGLLDGRLRNTPVPLVVDASSATAEQLAAEARELGCDVEVIRARRVLGARLKANAATAPEMLAAWAMHVGSVAGLGLVGFLLGFPLENVAMLPALMAVVGVGAAAMYVRRPLLACRDSRRDGSVDGSVAAMRTRLSRLKTSRARLMAAGAVARATPVLLQEDPGIPAQDRREILDALERAVEAATNMDAHCLYLSTRSRSRMAVELDEAQARAAKGDAEGVRRVAELAVEQRDLLEAALAHDLCARQALEACAVISSTLLDVNAGPKRLKKAPTPA